MVLELPTVNWKAGLKWCHMCMWRDAQRVKWLKLITYTCGQCSSNQDEAVYNILRTCIKIPLSGNAVVLSKWTKSVWNRRVTAKLPRGSEDSCLLWAAGKQHRLLLPATGQCLLCNSWDCALMRPTDASWNTLQINHKLFWHLFAVPFHIADGKAEGISVYRVGLCLNLL